MAECFQCRNGTVVCGNPAPPCGATFKKPEAQKQWRRRVNKEEVRARFETMTIDVWKGKLRVTSDPELEFLPRSPKKVEVRYDDKRRLFVRII